MECIVYDRIPDPARNFGRKTLSKSQIMQMFRESVEEDEDTLKAFCEALETGDAETIEMPGHAEKRVVMLPFLFS